MIRGASNSCFSLWRNTLARHHRHRTGFPGQQDCLLRYLATTPDIGGISAGSLPPNSAKLWQEGTANESVKPVHEGHFDKEAIRYHLLEAPAKYPGCSSARNLSDNLADLRAQTGANQKGIKLINQLIRK